MIMILGDRTDGSQEVLKGSHVLFSGDLEGRLSS